ncbi:DUF2254 domain-containing protein [Egbenema bharatensis]|uniref:DUF2254 domain-containing protein n=1 Tax=Egbenema bharatensis TaxID=3463334 RepID=UPI003A84CF05
MKNAKFDTIWDSLRASYWFLPTLMAIGAMALSTLMLLVDSAEIEFLHDVRWIYTGGPDGARQVLSTVAGSMATVATTAFSITIVALQLASSSFGSRLLRNFMQDRGNQFVLGAFVSTYVYSLLVLRTIRNEDFDFFVPQLSVTVGMILAVFSIGVLIYFIHHAATIIQASHVLAEVSDELHDAIDRLFPQPLGHSIPDRYRPISEIPIDFTENSRSIQSERTGYLQLIDDASLMKLARQHDLLIHLRHRPGKFIIQNSDIARVYPAERVNSDLARRINKTLILGKERTEQQDVEFPIDQLVETATRALSPGINDPFTAIRCIDRLAAGLCHLAQREIPSAYRYDEDDQLRVITVPIRFESIVDQSFNQIRQYGKTDLAVMVRLLEGVYAVAKCAHNPVQRTALTRHAEMILRSSQEGLSEEYDRKLVAEQYNAILEELEEP